MHWLTGSQAYRHFLTASVSEPDLILRLSPTYAEPPGSGSLTLAVRKCTASWSRTSCHYQAEAV